MLSGTETELTNILKQQAELEMQMIQVQGNAEVAYRDRRQAQG